MWGPSPKVKESRYFRRKFYLEKIPKSALLSVSFDDDGEVYVNGEAVVIDHSKHLETEPTVVDIKARLLKGNNIIAVKGEDSVGGCQWIQLKVDIEHDVGTQLDVPLFKQTDAQWSSEAYDHAVEADLDCGTTVGQCGCAMTSIAMVLKYHGVDRLPTGEELTPETLNNYFIKDEICGVGGCASKGYAYGAVRWNATNSLTKEAFDLFGSPKVQFVGGGGFDEEVVRRDILQGNPVILKTPNISHWIVAKGFTEDTFNIHDPAFSRTTLDDPAYGNAASVIRRYKKVNSDFSLIEAFVKTPGNILITDMYGRRAGWDLESGQVVEEIPGSSYVFEPDVSLDINSSSGVMWLLIQLPEEGAYMIQSTADAIVYISSKDAQEDMLRVADNTNIYYDPLSGMRDLNPRPPGPQPDALAICANPRNIQSE